MNRRDLIRAGAALPLAATPGEVPAQTPATAPGAWQPSVFDQHQNETVIALADLIIPDTDTPGAKQAGVNRIMDLLLRDGSDEDRRQFLEGLAGVDGVALRRHQKPFVGLSRPEQTNLLEALAAGDDPGLAGSAQFFRQFKGLTARIYYSTETGFKELNKGGRVPASYGCRHPEHG
jgi:hypothetical protein